MTKTPFGSDIGPEFGDVSLLQEPPSPPKDEGSTPPPPDGDYVPPEPEWEEPEWEEPEWEEPIFESVSVASVLWGGKDDWDRAIYKLSNGRTAYGSKGLGVDDVLFDYEEFRTSGGGYYGDPNGKIVGQIHTRNGEALILQRGEGESATFHQQMYAWGNQGPVMSSSTQDVSNQIGKIEESANSDIDGDGYIGVVEAEEAEVEIDSALYDNPDGDMDRSIYKMSDGSVYFAEQGLEKGDLPMEGDEISKKDGSPINTDGLVGMMGMRNGMATIYYKDGVLTQQGFKWSNRGMRETGRLRDVTKQLDKIEERMSTDLNNDQMIGGQMDEDAEVKSVIYNYGGDDGFDRSLYEMDNGVFMLAEPGLIPGELPFESDPISGPDGKPYNATGAVGLMGMNNGFAMIFNETDKYSMQMFKWGGRGVQAKGKKRDITRRIYDTEDRADADFTNDGIIGKPHSGKGDPEISRVIFPGNEEYDQGLYQMQDGTLLFAEPDLIPGDSPFEDEVIFGKNGKPLQIPNVVGIYPIKSGFSLVQADDNGKYIEQGFKFGRKGPQPFGKPRKIKNIDKTEKRI